MGRQWQLMRGWGIIVTTAMGHFAMIVLIIRRDWQRLCGIWNRRALKMRGRRWFRPSGTAACQEDESVWMKVLPPFSCGIICGRNSHSMNSYPLHSFLVRREKLNIRKRFYVWNVLRKLQKSQLMLWSGICMWE